MLDTRDQPTTWLIDMDGVLIHEEVAFPVVEGFIGLLQEKDTEFLVLTNNSIYTRCDLSASLADVSLDVPEERIWTSAVAAAQFLSNQKVGHGLRSPASNSLPNRFWTRSGIEVPQTGEKSDSISALIYGESRRKPRALA
jgi:hypothetical protein